MRGLHEFLYADRNGTFRMEKARLADRALLLQRGEVTVRIEGRLSRAEAISIAQSLR